MPTENISNKKENFDKLRDGLHKETKKYLKTHTNNNNNLSAIEEERSFDANANNFSEEIDNTIDYLAIIRDEKKNIHSEIKIVKIDGKEQAIVFRDARNQIKEDKDYSYKLIKDENVELDDMQVGFFLVKGEKEGDDDILMYKINQSGITKTEIVNEYDINPDIYIYIFNVLLNNASEEFGFTPEDIDELSECKLFAKDKKIADKNESLAIYNLNIVKAAMQNLEANGQLTDAAKKDLMDISKEIFSFAQENSVEDIKQFKKFNSQIVGIYSKYAKVNVKEAIKILDIWKDSTYLDKKPKAVVTIQNVLGKDEYTLSTPITELTEKQKNHIEKREQEKWFKDDHSDNIKSLINKKADYIIDGSQTSSQHREMLPGLRNAYVEDVVDIETDSKKLTSIHAGSVVFGSKDFNISKEFTKDNIEQLKEFTGRDEVHIMDHTTHAPYISPEGNIGNVLNSISEEDENVDISNFPLNAYRKIFPSTLAGSSKLLKTAKNLLETSLPKEEVEYLNRSIFSSEQRDNIVKDLVEKARENPDKKNLYKILILAVELKYSLNPLTRLTTIFSDPHVNNLQITVDMNILSSCIETANDKPNTAVISCCKSGKDRNGLVRIYSDIKNIALDHIISDKEKNPYNGFDDLVRVEKKVARDKRAEHHTYEAGSPSNTMGCDSLKKCPLPKSLKDSKDMLFNKVAKFNKLEEAIDKSLLKTIEKENNRQKYTNETADKIPERSTSVRSISDAENDLKSTRSSNALINKKEKQETEINKRL